MPDDASDASVLTEPMPVDMRAEGRLGAVDWLFRSRKTGRITVAQAPNWPLVVWALASTGRWLGHPQGRTHELVVVVATAALALWASDEVLRGVNPFRRAVGGAVLAWLVVSH